MFDTRRALMALRLPLMLVPAVVALLPYTPMLLPLLLRRARATRRRHTPARCALLQERDT